MVKQISLGITVALLLTILTFDTALGRMATRYQGSKDQHEAMASFTPALCLTAHRVGNIVLAVSNDGTFGIFGGESGIDCFTGDRVTACEYPKRSNSRYLYAAAFWIGAVVGRDTLVSTGADGWIGGEEFLPDEEPFGNMIYRSMIDPSSSEFEDAVSEEDYVAVYTDTVTEGVDQDYTGRAHLPLHIEVTQSSFAWSYQYAEDIVLFDYRVTNIGAQTLEEVYMGIYVDADIHFEGQGIEGAQDDITGFVVTMPAEFQRRCQYTDTVFIAWTADNDGDLTLGTGQGHPSPNVTATRIVRTPAKELNVSFNWWISNMNATLDFGPREKPFQGAWKEDFRNFGTGGLGTPMGDRNKYYVLRNREFDYDQIYTASISATDSLWLLPPQSSAVAWSRGLDTRYTLSFGPFNINPGERLPISFAYLGGEGFHTVRDNLDNLPQDPDIYYRNLDFSDLGQNSRWASWIYDNPGVDTDGDGYYGEYFLCPKDTVNPDWETADTAWTKGDGVPDFLGASPPPAPDIWIEPSVGALKVRFNGRFSETTPDVFSRSIDFEGYRIYVARDERATSYSRVASYDIEDYNKYVRVGLNWDLLDEPFTLDELRCLYGDSCNDATFDPLDYTPSSPYVLSADSTFYFQKQDYNASVLGVTTNIRKRFPDQPYPSTLNPDSARPEELTEDGYLKYFEYEYEITDLLPTVHYWVNVTAFDFGSPQSGLPSLETSLTVGSKEGCPLASWSEVQSKGLKVFVWPNPYRIDGEYRAQGFEGRGRDDRPEDRVRAVHFGNLPPRCTIRIYTLDGDLVREIVHEADCVGPCATTDSWNLITRNTQLAVSGLYYWTVEDDEGDVQIGKLMLVM